MIIITYHCCYICNHRYYDHSRSKRDYNFVYKSHYRHIVIVIFILITLFIIIRVIFLFLFQLHCLLHSCSHHTLILISLPMTLNIVTFNPIKQRI